MSSTKALAFCGAAVWSLLAVSTVQAQIVYPFPPYAHVYHDSSVRIQVTPRDAEVYVDGYYAGIVDDFDGTFQRLRINPGQHEITIFRQGYRPFSQRVYLAVDRTFNIKAQLEPLAPGEPEPARPVAPAPPASVSGGPPPRPLPQGRPREARDGPGRLSLRIEPADAEVTIDGQPWTPAGPDRVVDVSPGRHVIQVRKAGYVGYLTEVEVQAGETTAVTVTLRPQP